MKFSELVEKLGPIAANNSLNTDGEPEETAFRAASNPDLTGVCPIDTATNETISYIEGPKFASMVTKTNAGALILPEDESLQQQANTRGLHWIATPEPRLLFSKVIDLFYQPFQPTPAIHPTAVIDPTAQIGNNVYIGPHVVIYPHVTIGDQAWIFPNVVIYPHATIGSRTILHANCTIHERTQIGADCVIHSSAVIGAEGFGFVPTSQGWYKMQQSGYTVLEDGVEIGCNSNVDRPAVGETRIGKRTKIDNLVQIGHGCQVGSNCAFASQVGLAGGVKVGNNVLLAGQVGIANQVKIGDGAIATAKSGIAADVAPKEIVSGIPAISNKLFLKIAAVTKRLPEIYQAFKNI